MDREHKRKGSSSRGRNPSEKSDIGQGSYNRPKPQSRSNLLSALNNIPTEYSRQDWDDLLGSSINHSNCQDNESEDFYSAKTNLDSIVTNVEDPVSDRSNSSDSIFDVYFDALGPNAESLEANTQEPEITEDDVKDIVDGFKKVSQNKKGIIRYKGRDGIIKTIENLLEQFYQCPDQDRRNANADKIISLCHVWKKKHVFKIIKNQHYKLIRDNLNELEQTIVELKDKPLATQEGEYGNKKRQEKTQAKADKLLAKYKNYEGTPDGFFNKVVPHIIDLAIPDTGDKAKFEAQLRFPVQPGVFVGMRVTASLEKKNDDEFKVGFEGNAQVGGTLHGVAALGGELGVYFESIAKDSKNIGKLLDYGLYRRFRESRKVPKWMTSKIWGGESGEEGYKKAEETAAAVEQDVFGEKGEDGNFTRSAIKSQVEWGGNAGLIADYGIHPIGTGKAGAQFIKAQRYSQYTIDNTRGSEDEHGVIPQGDGVGKTDLSKIDTCIKPQKSIGQGSERVILSNSGSFGGQLGSYGIKLKLDLTSKPGTKWRDLHINKWEVELEGGAKIPGAAFAANPALAAVPIATGVAIALRNIGAMAEGKYKNKTQKIGAITSLLPVVGAQLTTSFKAQSAYQVPEILGKNTTQLTGLVGVGVNFKVGQEVKPDEQLKDGKANLEGTKAELAFQQIAYTGLRFLDSEVKLETAKRIMNYKNESGKGGQLELFPLTWDLKNAPESKIETREPKGRLGKKLKKAFRRGKKDDDREQP